MTSRDFAGIHRTSRDFAGLRGSSISTRNINRQKRNIFFCSTQWAWGAERLQVKSNNNTPVMQGAKQMHIERKCDYELRQSCRLGRACVDFLTQVLLWFCLALPGKGSAKGGVICDARVEVHPVNLLTSHISSTPVAAKDPETQPHFIHSGGRDSSFAFHWESPTKENFAHGIR